ncbi:MAG TPA: isopropylmalate synthase [Ruminiclostridium sp.]|nr:isopropylmalate synthase [Ruminiclostridium sp.]
MIRITDVTLCTLDYEAAPKEKIKELYRLLLQTGINFIEIDIPLLGIIGNIDEVKTILRVRQPLEVKAYPGFAGYVCRLSGFETPPQVISEIQVNDVREINLLKRYTSNENVRIIGLDDLLLHDHINMFTKIKRIFKGRLELCPQNRYYCATALAAEWVLNEGENIAASFSGSGGFAALEELIMILRIAKRHKPNMDLSVFRYIKRLYEELTGWQVPQNKAVIGERIFDVESGIHVDGILKNGSNYEPFEPSVVGMARKIVIGKHSGKSTMELKLKEHGLEFPQKKIPVLLERVQQESIQLGRSLTDNEFIAIAQSKL